MMYNMMYLVWYTFSSCHTMALACTGLQMMKTQRKLAENNEIETNRGSIVASWKRIAQLWQNIKTSQNVPTHVICSFSQTCRIHTKNLLTEGFENLMDCYHHADHANHADHADHADHACNSLGHSLSMMHTGTGQPRGVPGTTYGRSTGSPG